MKANMTHLPMSVNYGIERFSARVAGMPVMDSWNEGRVQWLAKLVSGKKPEVHYAPWVFDRGEFWVQWMGRCRMGRLIGLELATGPKFGFLLDEVGNVVTLSLADEVKNVYRSGVRFSKAGEIVELDAETLKKLKLSGDNHVASLYGNHGARHGLGELEKREYRTDWHDCTRWTQVSRQAHTLRILGGRAMRAA